MEWLIYIGIGFICIAGVILLFLYIWYMPWFVIVAYFLWLICSVCSITFSKGKEKKWYGVILTFIFTFIFTVLFLGTMDTDHYMFDDGNPIWFVAPTLNLPAICLLGSWLNKKWQAKADRKIQAYNLAIDRQIREKRLQISNLEQSIKNKEVITRFVEMLDCCGENVAQLKADPRISNIARIASDIKKIREEIELLEKRKR